MFVFDEHIKHHIKRSLRKSDVCCAEIIPVEIEKGKTHCVRQTFSLQSLLLQSLLQRQNLSLVLFDSQFHCLTRLGAALLGSQPVNTT